jgi:hypothetical protein
MRPSSSIQPRPARGNCILSAATINVHFRVIYLYYSRTGSNTRAWVRVMANQIRFFMGRDLFISGDKESERAHEYPAPLTARRYRVDGPRVGCHRYPGDDDRTLADRPVPWRPPGPRGVATPIGAASPLQGRHRTASRLALEALELHGLGREIAGCQAPMHPSLWSRNSTVSRPGGDPKPGMGG